MPVRAPPEDVFLSYSAGDRYIVQVVAVRLQELGISVSFDRQILAGENFGRVIREQLAAARCVVVLWSENAVQSAWVDAEAEFARQRGVYLPVLIEDVTLPPPYNRIQTARLVNWKGNTNDPAFQSLVADIRRIIKTAPTGPEQTRSVKASQRSAEFRAEELYQENLYNESLLEYVDLEGTPFHERLNWNVTPGINVLLGRNGYGKTLLLRSLLALLQYDDQIAFQTVGKGSATISILRKAAKRRSASQISSSTRKAPSVNCRFWRFPTPASSTARSRHSAQSQMRPWEATTAPIWPAWALGIS